jgi:hypothetical protein
VVGCIGFIVVGFFLFAGSVVVVSYVKDGTLEFCCVVFVENVRWNVGVVTANKSVCCGGG